MSEPTLSEHIRKAKLMLQKVSLDLEAIAVEIDSEPPKNQMTREAEFKEV